MATRMPGTADEELVVRFPESLQWGTAEEVCRRSISLGRHKGGDVLVGRSWGSLPKEAGDEGWYDDVPEIPLALGRTRAVLDEVQPVAPFAQFHPLCVGCTDVVADSGNSLKIGTDQLCAAEAVDVPGDSGQCPEWIGIPVGYVEKLAQLTSEVSVERGVPDTEARGELAEHCGQLVRLVPVLLTACVRPRRLLRSIAP